MLWEMLCGGSGNHILREQVDPSARPPPPPLEPAGTHLGAPMATATQELEGAQVGGAISPLGQPCWRFHAHAGEAPPSCESR